MRSPGFVATLTWIGTYLVAGVLFGALEMAWTMNQTLDLQNLEDQLTGFTPIFFALAPLFVASWMARRVYRDRKRSAESERERTAAADPENIET
jgi:hypothetical protein